MLTPAPRAQSRGSCCHATILRSRLRRLSSRGGCSEGSEAVSSPPPARDWRAALAEPDLLPVTGQRAPPDLQPGDRCWAEHPPGDAEHPLR